MAICVLASGSRGNCTALVRGEGDARSVILIDAGLSPRRTAAALSCIGLSMALVRAVVFTHLDNDHAHPGWGEALPRGAALHIHRRHLGRAERAGLLRSRCEPFEGELDLPAGVRGRARLLHHDDLGVVCFRFHADDADDLGFATDVGRVSAGLIEHLAGVGVLAIESNYCPALQAASLRPDFLKRRITAGHGHLSNQQCVEAVRRIEPRRHVVALHLSRECNRVDLVAALHEGADYALTVAEQDRPTRWIGVPRRGGQAAPAGPPRAVALPAASLFHPAPATLHAHERQ
jgi:phosphoribosyl 1,2-cyclic phosphodiesterase